MLFNRAVDNMHELQIQTQQMQGIHIIRLSGAVEALNFEKLAVVLDKMFEETPPRVILECGKVEYIGSAQLRDLADVARCARAEGGDVKCVALAQTIQQVNNLIAGGDPIECFDELSDALASFRLNEPITR
jgi:anti-anti-sigma factor